MRSVVLLPDRNTLSATGRMKSDWSGAFRPEATAFSKLHQVPHIFPIDISKPPAVRRRASLQCIESAHASYGAPLERLAIFCHGWINGIQLGWLRSNLKDVTQRLAACCSAEIIVALYCCSTAGTDTGSPGGDGGFADALRDALCQAGLVHCQVDAHQTPGHTTRNPKVRRFRGEGSPVGGQGGQWIVEPGKAPLWRTWSKALRNPQNTLRLRFPLMTVAEIHAELIAQP